MRVAIVNLTGGGISGGYAKYLRNVVPRLRRDPRLSGLEVFVPPRHVDHLTPALGPLRSWPEGPRWRVVAHIRNEMARLRPDVVFVPNLMWLECADIPVVLMPQNMEVMSMPVGRNPLHVAAKNCVQALLGFRGCRRAARVIAISGFVRDFLVNRWGIPADRVGLVHFGCDDVIPAGSERRTGGLAGDARPFILSVGSIRPPRGLGDLLEAMATRAIERSSLRLVLCGDASPDMVGYAESLRARAARLGVAERVFWAGRVDACELAWYYRSCAAFVMTSRVEACPNTALEALSYGCQIISTESPPMPEMFGEAALYYRAGEPEELAARLATVLARGQSERESWSLVSETVARRFTWAETAARTVDEWARVAVVR